MSGSGRHERLATVLLVVSMGVLAVSAFWLCELWRMTP
jgi:hypothetical protein